MCQAVGEEHLFEHAKHEPVQPFHDLIGTDPGRFAHLRQKIDGAHDRAGDQLRKESDEEGEVGEAPDCLDLAAVDVERIADALKRVEADAERQDDFDLPVGHAVAQALRQAKAVVHEETGVFENRQEPEVGDQAHDEPRRAVALAWVPLRSGCLPRNRRRW